LNLKDRIDAAHIYGHESGRKDDTAVHLNSVALATSDGWQKLIAPDKKARTKRNSFGGELRA
jgi:hypothetical protein